MAVGAAGRLEHDGPVQGRSGSADGEGFLGLRIGLSDNASEARPMSRAEAVGWAWSPQLPRAALGFASDPKNAGATMSSQTGWKIRRADMT